MKPSRRHLLKAVALLPLPAAVLAATRAIADQSLLRPDNTLAIGKYALRTRAVSHDPTRLANDCADGLGEVAFITKHREDFRTGNTITLQGSILSGAEVSRSALRYLQQYA